MRIITAIAMLVSLVGGAAAATDTLDPGSAHYSALRQLTPLNVSQLGRAWVYHTGEKTGPLETVPVVAGGLLYFTSQSSRVIALEPETGREVWQYDPNIKGARENRGVSYWPGDGRIAARIFLGTSDGRLIALNAKTGKPETGFADGGSLDLRKGGADAWPKAAYAITSPPAIYRSLVIVGPSTQENGSRGPSGDPRAFDARTGALVWRFHTVPQPGEPGNETWGPEGWKDRAGPSLWGKITVDVQGGTVFLGVGNPADSFYGGDRKGTNLYANCVVALNADTGKLRWYYQLVHHDIFDYDVTGSPALIEVRKDGRRIPAVAEITKMGLLFILDRATGKPVFGVEERPVPSSEIPGEAAWPTQPFPLKPGPLARTTISSEDLSTRTPEAAKYCAEQFAKYTHGDLFTPFGLKPTLVFPGAMGGGNFGGVSFDPALPYIFVNTTNMGNLGHMVPATPGSAVPYRNETAYARFLDQESYPCQRPPWGELSAVNANTGDIAWRVSLGSNDQFDSEAYKNAGTPNVGGSVATAGGLVFIAATNDSRVRAFDSRTGKQVWVGELDATAGTSPVTYSGKDGKQYVVIAAGGAVHLKNVGDHSKDIGDSVIAFALGGTIVTPRTVTVAPMTANTTPNGSLPDGAGRDIVMRVCSQCHGTETFSTLRMSRNEWRAKALGMKQRGASMTDAEISTIADYLGKYLDKTPAATSSQAPATSR